MTTFILIAWPVSLVIVYLVGSNNPLPGVRRKIVAKLQQSLATKN